MTGRVVKLSEVISLLARLLTMLFANIIVNLRPQGAEGPSFLSRGEVLWIL